MSDKKMKKVLILAYDFPPYVSVGGLRPYAWYKYLKEFGVEPIVITRQWENVHGNHLDYISEGSSDQPIVEESKLGAIIRAPYHPNAANRLMLKHGEHKFRLLRKSITAFYEFMQFFFAVGPKANIYKTAKQYLKSNKVDVIIATGDPFVLFSYAAKLSEEFKVPWIADYRDPWSHNQEHQKTLIEKKWNSYFEKKTVSTATHIRTVSKFVHSKIDTLIPNKPFSISPNGYDTAVIDKIKNIQQNNEEFCISFVGTIYNWHPIQSFLRVANIFVSEHPNAKIKFKFYGTNLTEELKQMVKEQFPSLKNRIVITPKIQNNELLEKLASDNAMLLFNYYSYMGTKIFDYLGIRRKMIMCYENDPEANLLKQKYYSIDESGSQSKQLQADLITETNSGIIVKDSIHLLTVLEELYAEFQATGQIACDSHGVEQYSRKIQVERLAELIKEFAAS
jgi:glycosyltransferase involved in cell wall biosynthesis